MTQEELRARVQARQAASIAKHLARSQARPATVAVVAEQVRAVLVTVTSQMNDATLVQPSAPCSSLKLPCGTTQTAYQPMMTCRSNGDS